MNNHLAGFCSGLGVAGILVLIALTSGSTLLLGVLVAWSIILTPMVVLDILYDAWQARQHG